MKRTLVLAIVLAVIGLVAPPYSFAVEGGDRSGCVLVDDGIPFLGCYVYCENEGDDVYSCLGDCGATAAFCGYDRDNSSEGSFEDCIKKWCSSVIRIPKS